MKRVRQIAGLVLLGACSLLAQAQTATHLYLLNGSLADEMGGPALVAHGGTLGVNGYTFGLNQGLSLAGALPTSVYTVDLQFSFDDLGGWRKIVQFKGDGSDNGIYAYGDHLQFYPQSTSSDGVFAAGQLARLTLTRDATGLFSAYVNGTQVLSFNDSVSADATYSESFATGVFFQDDHYTSGYEAGTGVARYLRVYDQALTADQVAALSVPVIDPSATLVPEPQTWALMLAGVVALGANQRRTQRRG